MSAHFSWAAPAVSPAQAAAANAWGEGCERLKGSSLLIYINEYKLMQFSFLWLADMKGHYDSEARSVLSHVSPLWWRLPSEGEELAAGLGEGKGPCTALQLLQP